MNPIAVLAAEGVDPAHSIHWLWPEQAELIFGSAASIIVFVALFVMLRKPTAAYFKGRTEKVQGELDAAAADKKAAAAEAADIRQAAGDIDAERKRLFEEADRQAETILSEGRVRLDEEVAELEARAAADLEGAASRSNDELAAEISYLSQRATEAALADGIVDGDTQQELIEAFIARVGQGVTS